MKQLVAIVVSVLLAACTHPSALKAPEGVTLTPVKSISTMEAGFMLMMAGVGGLAVKHAVDCYRMEYSVAGPDGAPRRMSGLLALPRGVKPTRLVSFAHGTTTTRTAVPSQPDGTGLAAAIVFAGNGYALIAPDYPGLGASPGKHPYYVADSIVPAVLGMIDAARPISGTETAPVFLSGFSEGGWVTMQTLRALEKRGEAVLGAAPVAGAFDLRGLSLPAAMKGDAPSHSLYLAYAAWGQAAYYGHALDSVLTPQVAQDADRLFSGASPQEIVAGLPKSPRGLFGASFLKAFDTGGRHWMLDAFAANSMTDFSLRTPARFYYGAADKDVSPAESVGAAEKMRAAGGDAQAVNVGDVGHDPSMLKAAPKILAWLAELEAVGEAARR